ncbi:MAG TPA: GNAT family N-acetyltransferase [Gammaproteobacteria bacterium]|nr:GNAT family N-acetyltransferase [Gammaproteobacteria bacterium]
MTIVRPAVAVPSLRIQLCSSLTEIPAAAWNRLASDATPFLRHEFLAGLEQCGCLRGHGWEPVHILAYEGGLLVGALPLYLKSNSHGEFVFDWDWAEAYQRAGRNYYPKLVTAVPYTPVAGPRLLTAPDAVAGDRVRGALLEQAQELMRDRAASSWHCLFPNETDADSLVARGGLRRLGCQYHWHNAGYDDFEDFLSRLDSKHRKQIRRERREIKESGITVEVLSGPMISEETWRVYHEFYRSTFHRKWGEPRLTLEFFMHLGRALPDQTLLFMAKKNGAYIAGAFAMRDAHTLYGRHWGCRVNQRHLHFEVCYYQTMDYCMGQGLRQLNAGAQGEHKISRGFAPVPTWSVHWLRDPRFALAVADFLERETRAMQEYMTALEQHSPYRRATEAA